MREEHGMPVNERGHAADAEARARRQPGERAEERHRLEPWLGEEAVAHPDGVEGARALARGREVDEIAHADGAEHDRAIGKDQAE
jgi:hypothetical protein